MDYVIVTVLCDAGYGIEELFMKTYVGSNIVQAMDQILPDENKDRDEESILTEANMFKEMIDAIEVTVISGGLLRQGGAQRYCRDMKVSGDNPTRMDWEIALIKSLNNEG